MSGGVLAVLVNFSCVNGRVGLVVGQLLFSRLWVMAVDNDLLGPQDDMVRL